MLNAAQVLLEIHTGIVWVANAGDSRCILSRGGKAEALSDDHKPDRADESMRIRRAGGFVHERRVMGELAVSRAFGDPDYKAKPSAANFFQAAYMVVATPEITKNCLVDSDDYLVLACDGLFDVFTNQEVCKFVADAQHRCTSLNEIARELVDHAIGVKKTRDNVSVVILAWGDPSSVDVIV